MDGDGLGYDLVESVCLLWLVFVVLNVTVVVLTGFFGLRVGRWFLSYR